MAISYTFTDVRIHVFDLNIVQEILTAPNKALKNEDYRILADQDQYDEFQESKGYLLSSGLVGMPYPPKHKASSTLWRRYLFDETGNAASSWAMQIPIYIRLRKQDLSVVAIPAKERDRVRIDSYATLNSLGWSTHIQIRLKLPLKPSQLADLCASLRDDAYGPEPYRLNGKRMRCADIFAHYRKLLFQDVFSRGVIVNRHENIRNLIFVDVLSANGELTPYHQYPVQLIISLANIVNKKNQVIRSGIYKGWDVNFIENMLVSAIDRDFYNFSITDFHRGTFTFLQREALEDHRPGGASCYANNTRDGFWLSYTWLEYYRRMKDIAERNPLIRGLLISGSTGIRQLEMNYNGRTSKGLIRRYKPLQPFIDMAGSDDGDDEMVDETDIY